MHSDARRLHSRLCCRGLVLPRVCCQVDLGFTLSGDFKASEQWQKAASKGFKMLWMIRRVFGRLTGDMFTKLFTAFGRPHLEYCVQVNLPSLVRDKLALERVMRVGTRLVHDSKCLPYPQRLDRLGM